MSVSWLVGSSSTSAPRRIAAASKTRTTLARPTTRSVEGDDAADPGATAGAALPEVSGVPDAEEVPWDTEPAEIPDAPEVDEETETDWDPDAAEHEFEVEHVVIFVGDGYTDDGGSNHTSDDDSGSNHTSDDGSGSNHTSDHASGSNHTSDDEGSIDYTIDSDYPSEADSDDPNFFSDFEDVEISGEHVTQFEIPEGYIFDMDPNNLSPAPRWPFQGGFSGRPGASCGDEHEEGAEWDARDAPVFYDCDQALRTFQPAGFVPQYGAYRVHYATCILNYIPYPGRTWPVQMADVYKGFRDLMRDCQAPRQQYVHNDAYHTVGTVGTFTIYLAGSHPDYMGDVPHPLSAEEAAAWRNALQQPT